MSERWPSEHVVALAPDASAAAAARRLAVPSQWRGAGCDEESVWGLCSGSGKEPYQTVVELDSPHEHGPAYRCSCPSRKFPCKHALGLLMLWSAGHVPSGVRPAFAAEWLAKRAAKVAASAAREVDRADPQEETPAVARAGRESPTRAPKSPDPGRDKRIAERANRVASGLAELDRWLVDAVRGGLTAASLAQYGTWDQMASRLVDAQAGSLANRVKRVGGMVGVGPGWHEQVLGELGTLHLLCAAGGRLDTLPDDLADSVRAALGWQVRQADVLDRSPESDTWIALGRSDTLEDRIVVRRAWLRGERSSAWALILVFAAYDQSLDERLVPGVQLTADLHRYPGRNELRCLLGSGHSELGRMKAPPQASSIAGACDEIGRAIAGVPWLERWPIVVHAAPTVVDGRWVLTDHTGSLPIAGGAGGPVTLVAVSGGRPVTVSAEWTAAGLLPLAVFVDGRVIDIGPTGGFHEKRWSA